MKKGLLFGVEFSCEGGLAGIEVGNEFFGKGEFGLGDLVSAAGALLATIGTFFESSQVGEHEFGIDDLDVTNGIDRSGDVVDVRTLKAADDLNDGVHLADVAQELVAETLALAGSCDEAGDIDKLNRGGKDFFLLRNGGEFLQAVIGHVDDTDVRFDRAEREVSRLGFAGASDGVEEGGFTDIGQSDDSSFEHMGSIIRITD